MTTGRSKDRRDCSSEPWHLSLNIKGLHAFSFYKPFKFQLIKSWGSLNDYFCRHTSQKTGRLVPCPGLGSLQQFHTLTHPSRWTPHSRAPTTHKSNPHLPVFEAHAHSWRPGSSFSQLMGLVVVGWPCLDSRSLLNPAGEKTQLRAQGLRWGEGEITHQFPPQVKQTWFEEN